MKIRKQMNYVWRRPLKSLRLLIYIVVYLLCSYDTYALDSDLNSAYRAIFSGDMGYTLIGEKPISSSSISENCLWVSSCTTKKCLSTLQKIFKNSDTYIFKVLGPIEEGRIELIHKKAVQECILSNPSIQNFIRTKFDTQEKFFAYMEKDGTSIFDFDSYTRGILFGYGEENAMYFCRYVSLGIFLKKHPFVRVFPMMWAFLVRPDFPTRIFAPYAITSPKVGAGFMSLEEEWTWLHSVDIDFKIMRKERMALPPCYIDMPIYRCKKGVESEVLRRKYLRARTKLAELFSKKSYQKAVKEHVTLVSLMQ